MLATIVTADIYSSRYRF